MAVPSSERSWKNIDKNKHRKECLPDIIQPFLKTSRILGLMPKSTIEIMWFITITGCTLCLLLNSVNYSYDAISKGKLRDIGGFGNCLCRAVVCIGVIVIYRTFWSMEAKWNHVCDMWIDAHETISLLVEPVKISRNIYILTIMLILFQTVGYVLVVIFAILECHGFKPTSTKSYNQCFSDFFDDVIDVHFIGFGELSDTMKIAVYLLGFIVGFSKVFGDIFIVSISIGLSARYEQINKFIEDTVELGLPRNSARRRWQLSGELFAAQAGLVKAIDLLISPLLLFSLLINVIFICSQIVLLDDGDAHERKNEVSKICPLIASNAGALTVFLCASSVHENSGKSLLYTYLCPTEMFTIEVERLQHQIIHQEVYLTGMHLFAITRSFILGVWSGIISFTVIFFQLKGVFKQS